MATKSARRKRVDMSKARIRIVAKENPRHKGTGAAKRFDEMKRYLSKHRTAPAKQVLKDTAYRSDDLNWDKQRGHIKLVG